MTSYTNVTPGPLAIDHGYLVMAGQTRDIRDIGDVTKAHITHGRLIAKEPPTPKQNQPNPTERKDG